LEVNLVAVVCVAAVDIEQARCAQAVERLPGWHQVILGDASADMLLLAVQEGSGGHAGPVRLTLKAGLPAGNGGAVAPKSCIEEGQNTQ